MPQYGPETLILLRTALDEAWALLPDHRKSGTRKSEMAQRILKQAAEGVRARSDSGLRPLLAQSMDRSNRYGRPQWQCAR